MKTNMIKALRSLFFASFVVQLQAGQSSNEHQVDNRTIKSITKNAVRESIVNGVASFAHADQLQLLDKLDYHAGQIMGSTQLIQSTKACPNPFWVQYVPVNNNNMVEYVSCGQPVEQYDPYTADYINQCGMVVHENFEQISKEVTTKRPFLGHGTSAIALFETTHDQLSRSVNASDGERIKRACQDYQALVGMQKKWIHSEVEKQMVKQNAAYQLIKRQEKKAQHKAKIAQQALEQNALLAKRLQEQAVAHKQVKLATQLAQEHKVAQESKACMIDQINECKSESKVQAIKEDKTSIKLNPVNNKKSKDIKSLELFMNRADALINAGDSLATVEQRLHYAQSTLTSVFLDEADRALLHVNTIEPMLKHLNELKNSKKNDVAFQKAQNKLKDASKQSLGALGYLAREKWQILTGITEEKTK